MKPPPEARWHAGADGEGHAFLVGKANVRALCDAPRHDERFDHPIAHRCDACTTELNRLIRVALTAPAAARGWTEAENREAFGR